MGKPSLALVVPCYNEADRLPRDDFLQGMLEHPDWVWILVDDGSKDDTALLLERLCDQVTNCHVLKLSENVGKAEAVRQGVLWALSQPNLSWVGYLDADLATPISELARLYGKANRFGKWFVFGSRMNRLGAGIQRNTSRHYLGRVAATAISLLLGLPTYDTQCGVKILEVQLARQIFQDPFCSRWLFDVELLARCRNLLGVEKLQALVLEEPLLEWVEKGGSKIRPNDLLRLPFELWKIHSLYNGFSNSVTCY